MYQGQVSAKIRQFGRTELSIRFYDTDGIMPTSFMSFSWLDQEFNQEAVDTKIAETITFLTQEWNTLQQQKLDEQVRLEQEKQKEEENRQRLAQQAIFLQEKKKVTQAFTQEMGEWLDNTLNDVLIEIHNKLLVSTFTKEQKDLLKQIRIYWEI